MNLNEVIVEHELTIDLANTRLQTEDGLVSGHTQINDTIVEAYILVNDRHAITFLFLLFTSSRTPSFSLLIEDLTTSILNLEWKNWLRLVASPKLFHVQLNFL